MQVLRFPGLGSCQAAPCNTENRPVNDAADQARRFKAVLQCVCIAWTAESVAKQLLAAFKRAALELNDESCDPLQRQWR